MERALLYEYLIRATFNCGRGGRHGADADIYRWMYNINGSNSKTDANNYRLGIIVGMISAHLNEAFNEAITLNEKKYDFVSKIERCKANLHDPTVEKLNKCVDDAWEAYTEINLTI